MIDEDRCHLVGGPHHGKDVPRPKSWPVAYPAVDGDDPDGPVAIYARGRDGLYHYQGEDA